jgi:N-methylhydantoinase B
MTNTRNTPIEAFEAQFPARVERYAVRRGSGGSGKQRGGEGIERRIVFLAPVRLTWVADRARRGPWGLAGGEPGARGRSARVALRRVAGEALGGSAVVDLERGDAIEVATPGGGGHGRPGRRAR